jgi:mitochondrial fission protein ELM1
MSATDAGPLQRLKLANCDENAASVTCWGVNDGVAGTAGQVRGLAEAVGLPFRLSSAPLRQPWKSLWPGMVPAARFVFQDPRFLDGPSPSLLITCGKQAVMTSLYLKKQLGDRVFTVHVQNPRISPERFDLVVAPEHDGLTGRNVISTMGALHHISPEVLARARANGPVGGLDRLRTPFVAVLIGGPTRHYAYVESDMQRLEDKLAGVAKSGGVSLAILPSRRTPQPVIERFIRRFGNEHLVWNRSGENPYLCTMAMASHLIVTGDSVSMITEAAGTGRPVYVEYLTERRPARRFRKFHDALQRAGISRSFEGRLESWTYEPRNDSALVAKVVRERLKKVA